MKKQYGVFQLIMSLSFSALLIFGFQACSEEGNKETKTEDAKEVAEDKNEAKIPNDSSGRDAQFLVNAAEINLEEIQLGQLAQKNGTTKHVKELGKMMEDEHTQALAELKALAGKKNISIPASLTEDGQDAYKKLNDQKKGKDFDKEFADMMVNGHKSAIDKFEKASENAGDQEIKAWATAMLPSLKKHLDHSIICKEECSKM